MKKRMLLISNSTMAGEPYLYYTKPFIKEFFKEINFTPDNKNIIFIPYAAVTFSFDKYVNNVNKALSELNIKVKGIQNYNNPKKAIEDADMIIVGGGNTWQLIKMLQDNKLLEPIKKKVEEGIPYIGWSAGSNVACPTIKTTNDMPIVEPKNFNAIGLINFQINPHYLDANPKNFGGETREQRIKEFLEANKNTTVVGLREGTMLYVSGNKEIILWGNKNARIFKHGNEPKEIVPNQNLLIFL